VAFLIMSVGILGILVLFPMGILASARSSNLSRSAVIARSALDMLANGGLGDAAFKATTKPTPEDGPWFIPEQISGADVLDDDGLIITGIPVDIDDDGADDIILCDEATAFSWNAAVSQALDASDNPIQGLYAVQIRVFRNFVVLDGPGTAAFTEGDRTVTVSGMKAEMDWLTATIAPGHYIRSVDANTDGLWYQVSAVSRPADTEVKIALWRAPGAGDSFSGNYVITKSLIAVYDTYLAAR